MHYCTYCGTRLDAGVSFCPNCGAKVERTESATKGESIDFAFDSTGSYSYSTSTPTLDTKPRPIVSILAFFFPLIAGLLVWLLSKDTCPGRATSALKGLLARACWTFPIIGLVLFFVWKNEKPDYAKIGIIFSILGFVVGFIYFFYALVNGVYYDYYDNNVTFSAIRAFFC